MRKLICTVALVAMAAVPSIGVAHSPNPNGSCDNIEGEAADLAVTNPTDNSGILYVVAAGPSVWSESNGRAGLQTHSHTCRNNATDEIITIGPDSKVL